MPLTLPTTPAPRMLDWRIVPPPRELRPEAGEGALQRIFGFQHFIVDFELPPMTYTQAMSWVGVFRATGTVIMPIHEPGYVKPSYGTPLVAGAGQSGATLNIDGLGAAEIVTGKFLSIVTSVRRYLYLTDGSVTPTAGAAAVPLMPLLRVSPGNDDVVELAAPKIEGFATVAGGMQVTADRLVHGLRFSIEEVR